VVTTKEKLPPPYGLPQASIVLRPRWCLIQESFNCSTSHQRVNSLINH